jgi:hypothetical protein
MSMLPHNGLKFPACKSRISRVTRCFDCVHEYHLLIQLSFKYREGLSVRDLRFSQQWLWRVLSSGLQHSVARWKSTDVSEEHVAKSPACYMLRVGFLLGLFFDPEDGGDMFLWNVGLLSTDYKALHPRRYNSSRFKCSLSKLERLETKRDFFHFRSEYRS